MKIVSILGSPRREGASSRIADEFINAAKSTGAETKVHFLAKKQYSGCTGCEVCRTESGQCIINDDVTEILNDVSKCDVVLFVSPVYWGDTTGQFKTFFDRMFTFIKMGCKCSCGSTQFKLSPGKTAVLIITQGDANETHHSDVVERYTGFLTDWLGFTDVKVIRAIGLGQAEDTDVDKYIKQAKKLAEEMMK